MSGNGRDQLTIDPEAPGFDEETRRGRRALAKLQQLSTDDFFQFLVRIGIYTEDGQLTPPYRNDEPSPCRPTDRRHRSPWPRAPWGAELEHRNLFAERQPRQRRALMGQTVAPS